MPTFTRIIAGLRLRPFTPGSVRALFALTFFVLAAPMCAAATTYYVSPNGNDNNAGTQAAPFLTINQAITNAVSGDTVTLADGTYTGPGDVDLDFGGKNIMVSSVNGAATTIIDCGGNATSNPTIQHRAFHFHANESAAVVTGLTIQHSYYVSSGNDGAVTIASGCTVTLNNCVFASNTISGTGGGVGNSGMVTLNSCNFTGNVGSGGLSNQGTATLTNCNFTNNNGDGVSNSGTIMLTGCNLTGNKAGGVSNASNNSSMTLTNCTLMGNTAQVGGGVYNQQGMTTLTGCTLSGNTATDSGGGIFNIAGTLTLTGCTLTGNNAANSGGGILQTYLYTTRNSASMTLTDCTVANNNASNGNGGGVYNDNSVNSSTLTNCVVASNTATKGNGGGVYSDGPLTLQFCTLSQNRVSGTSTQGGALENDSTATLTDDILWGNTAPFESEIGIPTSGNPVTTVTASDIQGGYSGNLHVDPLFSNPAAGKYQLQTGSPCLGAGTTIMGVTTDLLGNTRANPPTIGAYELAVAATPVTLASSANPSTAGQSVTFTATVTAAAMGAAPTGTVTFTVDGMAQSPVTLTAGGTAAYTTAALTVGPHTINATYSGDANDAPGTATPFAQGVNKAPTTTALTSSLNPAMSGQSVTFTATVTGSSPTGTVTFTDTTSNTTLGTGPVTLSGGVATLSTSSLTVGTHQITATYSGDTRNNGSVSTALAQVVNTISTTTALTSSLNPSVSGQSVTLTATVTPASGTAAATGTVQFVVDGSNAGSPVALSSSGQASVTGSGLTVGIHTITATYLPSGAFAGSAAAAFTQTVNAAPPVSHTQLLWNNVNGQAAFWFLNSNGTYAAVTYGPFSGWTAKAVAEAPNGTSYLLWTNTNGQASLWHVTGSGYTSVQYGPYTGYTAVSLSVGSDGSPHLLWDGTNGTALLWTINASTGAFTYTSYGPFAGYTANRVASGATVTDLLWTKTDGTAVGWRIAANGTYVTSAYGPFSGYSAVGLSVGPDDGAHLLWNGASGTELLWSANFAADTFTYTPYGPISGWATRAIATGPDNVTHLLWDNQNGQASLWNVTGSGYTHTEYGPFSGWTAVAVSAGP